MTVMMREDLEYAIEHQRLEVHYQPLFHLKSNRIYGAEALARWQHEQYGWIAPEDFIPLAEEMGLITDVGNFVLKKSCHSCGVWHATGYPNLTIAVNFSPLQFEEPKFLENFMATIAANHIKPTQVEIEVTESVMLSRNKSVTRSLHELREVGVRFAIDDFGTGYSSMSNLLHFPFDTIKIDKSFVNLLHSNQTNQVIIKTIIELAHNLDKQVVAEGVEDERQLDFLRENACDIIQGKVISMALNSKEFMEILKRY